MKARFEQLIADFCVATGLPNANMIMIGAPFQADDIVFSFRHEETAPESMLLYADFGPVPPAKRNPIFHALLTENFITAIGSTGTFGISASTDHIIYIEHLPVKDTAPETLGRLIAMLVAQAKEWRTTHYIGDTPETPDRMRAAASFNLKNRLKG